VATKLTKRTLDALEPREKPYVVFDGALPGFGLRVMPSGAKSFILEYRANGGGRGVAKSRLTLGRYGVITVDQARQAALTALARIRLGSDPQAEKNRQRSALSINDLAERFLEDRASALKPKTEKNYSAALAKLRKAHGTIKATALTREQVAALHKSMRTAPYAANWFLAAVSGLFSWASAQGLIPKEHANPARQIPRYREFARERFLTQDELARLGAALRTAPVDRYAVAAILVLLLTGARLNEILHARRDWLDAERGLLNLPDSKVGRRSLFLSAQALAVLQSLPRMHGNPYLFPGAVAGRPRKNLDRPWAFIKQAAELGNLRLHDLRHSFASVGAGGGLGLPVLGKLLGHSQPGTTQRYSHIGDDPARQAAAAISAVISAALESPKPASPTPLRRRAK
jgi:integrase